MNKLLMEQFEDCPVIAAVKDEEGLKACIDSVSYTHLDVYKRQV